MLPAMGKGTHDSAHLRCSFCGKPREQVKKLVAGPGVSICNQCIALCNEILDEDSRPRPPVAGQPWTKASVSRKHGTGLVGWLRNLLRSRALQSA